MGYGERGPIETAVIALVALPVAISGPFFVADVLYDQYLGEESYRWPRTTGTVVSVDTEDLGNPGNTRHVAAPTYRYEVDGRPHESSRLTYRVDHGDRTEWEARENAERFSPGQEVEVRYDPDDPSRAVLLPGGGAVTGPLLSTCFVWMLCVILAIFSVRSLVKRYRTRRAEE